MIVRGESTIIDYHAPFDQGFRASLESTKAEVEGLKEQADRGDAENNNRQDSRTRGARAQGCETRMLQQKKYNNKFFGTSDNEQESPEDTEEVLRNFLHKEMKLSKKHQGFFLQKQATNQIAHQALAKEEKVWCG